MSGKGIKRNGTSKGTAVAQSDFKRLKTKVGKKVVHAANETNTNFQKASLFVSSQSIEAKSSLLSSRGRSIAELNQLSSHPAGTARLSAIKGLSNIATRKHDVNLQSYLYVLLQVSSKSLVDEENDVRTAGLELLQSVLVRHDTVVLAPFIPILAAYAASALHSLDPAMKLDGVRAVEILASSFRSALRDFVPTLLPAIVNLLSERKEGKGLMTILKAIVALLYLLLPTDRLEASGIPKQQNLHFCCVQGARSRNALLPFRKKSPSGRLNKFSHIREIFEISQAKPVIGGSETLKNSVNERGHPISWSETLHQCRLKLCDLLVESFEEGSDELLPLSREDHSMNVIEVAAVAINYAWDPQICDFSHVEAEGEYEGRDKLATRTVRLLMECFPLEPSIGASASTATDELYPVNSMVIRTVLRLVLGECKAVTYDESQKWIDNIILQWISSSSEDLGDSLSDSQVDVVAELLNVIPRQENKTSGLIKHIHSKLYRAFFETPSVSVARSTAGLKAATILSAELIRSSRYDCVLADGLLSLPSYLDAWNADFESESKYVIDALRCVVRNSFDWEAVDIRNLIQEKMAILLQKKKAANTVVLSVFELSSSQMQRAILGLFRSMETISKIVLKLLAAICASGSADGANIFEMVSCVRKHIPMPTYLGFIISCIGVPRNLLEVNSSDFTDAIVSVLPSLDHRIRQGSKAIIDSGSARCLTMLMPQFRSWTYFNDGYLPTLSSLTGCRVAIYLLLASLWDLHQNGVQLSSIPEFTAAMDVCTKAADHILWCLSKITVGCDGGLKDRLLLPVALFSEFRNINGSFNKFQLSSKFGKKDDKAQKA